jgi:hypothetical protein
MHSLWGQEMNIIITEPSKSKRGQGDPDMNLYLDDIRAMPEGFDTLARNVEEAKAALLTGNVVKCSLDHDLGACDDCLRLGGVTTVKGKLTWEQREEAAQKWLFDSRFTAMPHCAHAGTGLTLLTWMIENNVWPKEKPTVHSANVVRAPIMRELIDQHWKAPNQAEGDVK